MKIIEKLDLITFTCALIGVWVFIFAEGLGFREFSAQIIGYIFVSMLANYLINRRLK